MTRSMLGRASRALPAVLAAALAPALLAVEAPPAAPGAAREKGPWLLVLNKSDDTLALVDPATLTVAAVLPTGKGPHEVAVAPDGRSAYVANYGTREAPGSTLTVVDLAARRAARSLDLGTHRRPHGIVTAGDGRIVVTCEGTRSLLVVDPASGRVERAFETGQEVTHMVVLAAGGRRAFTANIGSDTVTAVDLETGSMTQVPVGKGPEGIDVTPDGREVWIAHRGDGGITILDAASLAKVKVLDKVCATPIRLRFTPAGDAALVSCLADDALLVIDPASREVRRRIPAGKEPIGILPRPGSKTVYVAGTRSDTVSVVDLGEGKVTGSFSTGKEPDGMAWAPAQGD
jgi:YVTN family beta-propeller protein